MAHHLKSQAVRNNQAYDACEKQQLKRVRAEERVMPASASIRCFDHADRQQPESHLQRKMACAPVHCRALLLQQRS
jgi:hypothetical protein